MPAQIVAAYPENSEVPGLVGGPADGGTNTAPGNAPIVLPPPRRLGTAGILNEFTAGQDG